ncbi:MAG TPA: class I SAM-dependent methyltransferase, partial [Isosphaeraceae bacterium]|nr:class I SAM-dependent methyltransferase [Isosphaeraceae bacterium]
MRADVEAEWHVLTTPAGRALLHEAGHVERPGPADLTRWRRGATAAVVAAAVRLAECRRRGRAKFARAERMWLEPTGLEQATAEAVARHKAARFDGAEVFDLCCGIGGDGLALAGVARRVVAVDRDEGMTRRASWNAEVYEVADRLETTVAAAESVALPPTALVHIDPDRRAGAGPRARKIAQYQPNLEYLNHLMKTAPGGAIKLGPASDFEAHFGREGVETELVSLGGECKEATAWFGSLATCRRRATTLPSGASWTDRDGP